MNTPLPPFLAFFLAIVVQIAAWGICLVVPLSEGQSVMAHSVVAFLLATFVKLSAPWKIFSMILPVGAFFFIKAELPQGFLLIFLAAVTLLYLPTFWTHVPFFPTNEKTLHSVLSILPDDSPFDFIDLGCGFGNFLFPLSKRFPKASFVGIEVSPLACSIAKLRSMFCPNVTIRFGSFWAHSLESYDFVYAFLSPVPMPRLEEKLQREMRTGAKFLSNSFPLKREPEQTIVNDEQTLFLYSFGQR